MAETRPVERAPRVLLVAAGHEGAGASLVAGLVALAAQAEGIAVQLVSAPVASTDAELTVIDAGGRLDALAAAAALPDTRVVVVVASTDRAAMAASYAAVKAIAHQAPQAQVAVVANRLSEQEAQWACRTLDDACRRFLHRGTAAVGLVPEDRSLAVALAAGMSLADAADGSPAATAAARITQTLRARTLDARALDPSNRTTDGDARRAAALGFPPTPRRSQ
jgi:MinD-like ATPase involved in chromosome partitioning or flagellar assembly